MLMMGEMFGNHMEIKKFRIVVVFVVIPIVVVVVVVAISKILFTSHKHLINT